MRPVRPKVAMFYGVSCLYFWVMAKEPMNPANKLAPDFVYECYFDQWRRRWLKEEQKED